MAQSWVMFMLGQLQGQHLELLKKIAPVLEIHEQVRKGEIDPEKLDIFIGQEHFIEATKKFQANVTQLLAYAMMWRLDWRQEHGQRPEMPKDKPKL